MHRVDEMMKKIENFYRDLDTILKILKMTDLKISFTTWKYLSCKTLKKEELKDENNLEECKEV